MRKFTLAVMLLMSAAAQAQPDAAAAEQCMGEISTPQLRALCADITTGSVPNSERQTEFGPLYSLVRQQLLGSGWVPVPIPRDRRECAPGREDVCEKYPETKFCAGTGLAGCTLLWYAPGLTQGVTVFELSTQGEEPDRMQTTSRRCISGCHRIAP